MRVNNSTWKNWGFGLAVLTVATTFLIIQAKAAETSDAIAVRIMPNASHLSIDAWYKQQGFKGSPQKLMVDGYEAVRDGRTVFVNAANVENNKLYTNIYLISYNQESTTNTSDILGQLVSHWKFNSNLTTVGSCAISKISCANNVACPTDYFCSTGQITDGPGANSTNLGKCLPQLEQKCLVDTDCSINLFCDSAKAKVTRDVKRLGQLNDIKETLKATSLRENRYPELAGGTYIPGNSVSTWPSWQETFWPKLNGLSLMTDPINILGNCPNFDATTCWNNESKAFYQTAAGEKLNLPIGSYAYSYAVAQNGINYSLCATFETSNLYTTAEGQLSQDACLVTQSGFTAASVNTPPKIERSFVEGSYGLEFNGYIKALDDQNDAITWKLETGSTNFSSWSGAPVLKDSGDAKQKRIYATKTGTAGNYPVTLVLTDSRGATQSYNLILKVTANKPIIEASDIDYFVNPVLPLHYTFFAQSGNKLSSVTMTPKGQDIFGSEALTNTEVGVNRWQVDRSVLIPSSIQLPENKTVVYTITVTDEKNNVAKKDININLKAEKPLLAFDCDTNARVNQPYPINNNPCVIGRAVEGNHTLKYTLMMSPTGLKLTNQEDGQTVLSGTPTSISPAAGFSLLIRAYNEYGVMSEKYFTIHVNNYCGDGAKFCPSTPG